jgi:hypothetical protein
MFTKGQAKTPGSGRKKGSLNKRTAAVREAGDRAIAQMKEPFEGDGYAFLAMVYKDKDQPLSVRLSAAGMAMPYERPRLSQVDMTHRSPVRRGLFPGMGQRGGVPGAAWKAEAFGGDCRETCSGGAGRRTRQWLAIWAKLQAQRIAQGYQEWNAESAPRAYLRP